MRSSYEAVTNQLSIKSLAIKALHQNKIETVKSLFGILPQTMTLESAKEERVNEI